MTPDAEVWSGPSGFFGNEGEGRGNKTETDKTRGKAKQQSTARPWTGRVATGQRQAAEHRRGEQGQGWRLRLRTSTDSWTDSSSVLDLFFKSEGGGRACKRGARTNAQEQAMKCRETGPGQKGT